MECLIHDFVELGGDKKRRESRSRDRDRDGDRDRDRGRGRGRGRSRGRSSPEDAVRILPQLIELCQAVLNNVSSAGSLGHG